MRCRQKTNDGPHPFIRCTQSRIRPSLESSPYPFLCRPIDHRAPQPPLGLCFEVLSKLPGYQFWSLCEGSEDHATSPEVASGPERWRDNDVESFTAHPGSRITTAGCRGNVPVGSVLIDRIVGCLAAIAIAQTLVDLTFSIANSSSALT